MNEKDPLAKIDVQLDAIEKNGIADIIKRGELLQQAKKILATRGGWLRWLKGRHGTEPRTAQRAMNAAEFAKNVTVTHCKLTANALYLLSEDRFWKRADIGENARRAATEEVLKAAAKAKVGESFAKDIINKTLGKSEPADADKEQPADTEQQQQQPDPDHLLHEAFAEWLARGKKYTTKIKRLKPADVEAAVELLRAFADAIQSKQKDAA